MIPLRAIPFILVIDLILGLFPLMLHMVLVHFTQKWHKMTQTLPHSGWWVLLLAFAICEGMMALATIQSRSKQTTQS